VQSLIVSKLKGKARLRKNVKMREAAVSAASAAKQHALSILEQVNILTHFVKSSAPFMMEVADRKEADKKGGHLARATDSGELLLRELAQCPDEDEKAFQDTTKYAYFNTNNLWLDLTALKNLFETNAGTVPLPVIKNAKTVDPRDKASTKVLQLETAMGAAIGCFPGSTALVVDRSRFAPVKTTNDLLSLRSDAYVITEDFRVTLHEERKGIPPNIKLDGMYKFTDAMEKLIPKSPPSLLKCNQLTVEGNVAFAKGVVIKGDVTIKNTSNKRKWVPPGTYENDTLDLTDSSYGEAACGDCSIS